MGVFCYPVAFPAQSHRIVLCAGWRKFPFRLSRGPVLLVSGADLMDGTPIYDIKPYLPLADCRPEASGELCRSGRRGRSSVWRFRSPGAAYCHRSPSGAAGSAGSGSRPSYQHDPDPDLRLPFRGI